MIDEFGITHSAQPTPGSRNPYTILIADDYPDNLSLLSRYLEKEGYLFLTAQDGLEVLATARSEMPD